MPSLHHCFPIGLSGSISTLTQSHPFTDLIQKRLNVRIMFIIYYTRMLVRFKIRGFLKTFCFWDFLVQDTKGLQYQNDPSHPYQHMKRFTTLFCDCTVSTDLAALVSTSYLTLNLCRPSSWSERRGEESLYLFPPFLVLLNPPEMDTGFGVQDASC